MCGAVWCTRLKTTTTVAGNCTALREFSRRASMAAGDLGGADDMAIVRVGPLSQGSLDKILQDELDLSRRFGMFRHSEIQHAFERHQGQFVAVRRNAALLAQCCFTIFTAVQWQETGAIVGHILHSIGNAVLTVVSLGIFLGLPKIASRVRCCAALTSPRAGDAILLVMLVIFMVAYCGAASLDPSILGLLLLPPPLPPPLPPLLPPPLPPPLPPQLPPPLAAYSLSHTSAAHASPAQSTWQLR